MLECVVDLRLVSREDAGLQTVTALVHALDRFGEMFISLKHDERTKNLFGSHLVGWVGIREDRRLDERSITVAANQQPRSVRDRFLDPRFDAHGIGLANEWTTISLRVEWIAGLQSTHAFKQLCRELVEHRRVN